MSRGKKIFDTDLMTADERLAAVARCAKPDRVPLSLMIYYFAPFYTGTDMGTYLRDPHTYMRVMHKVYEDIGPWDIYYNINPFSRFTYSFVAMMRALWPGIELPSDSVVQIDEIEYMEPEDYHEIIAWDTRWAKFFGDMVFRLKMLPRFCQEANGSSGLKVSLQLLAGLLRQWVFWIRDFVWWKRNGVAIQLGYMAEMPFDTFSQGRNVINFSKDLFTMPDKIGEAATKLADSYASFSILVAKCMRVPRVQLFLHRTSNSFISPRQFESLAFPSIEIVVNRLVDAGITPILHCDGDWLKNLKILRRLPSKKCILQLDGLTDIFRAKEEIGDHMCIFGDVPAAMLVMGSSDEVDEYCHRLIGEVGKGGGFILGAGCEIPSNAKAENLRAMVSAVKKYGYYH
jgi:hypothetical protein